MHTTSRFADDTTKFEKMTLFFVQELRVRYSSRREKRHLSPICCNIGYRRRTKSNKKGQLPISIVIEMKMFHTSLKYARHTTFSVAGATRLCVDIGGRFVSILSEIAFTLTTRMILGIAFISEHVSYMELERRMTIFKEARTEQFLPSYTTNAVTNDESVDQDELVPHACRVAKNQDELVFTTCSAAENQDELVSTTCRVAKKQDELVSTTCSVAKNQDELVSTTC